MVSSGKSNAVTKAAQDIRHRVLISFSEWIFLSLVTYFHMINALLSHDNDIFLQQVEDEQRLIITIIDKVVN